MLTCIVCSKEPYNGTIHKGEEGEIAPGTPESKQAIKAITSQIKDMVVRASGAYKNCKSCSGSTNDDIHKMSIAESKTAFASGGFHCSYRRVRTWNSTANMWTKEGGLFSGEDSPGSVSGRAGGKFLKEVDDPKEWVSQVEPGVYITLVSLPQLGNNLKRIRFSRELFNKYQAQRWWSENCDKVMELYNVQRASDQSFTFPTPPRSEDEVTKLESGEDSPITEWIGNNSEGSSYSSGNVDDSGELSVSNSSDMESSEWIEEVEIGVYITIRGLPSGPRHIRRVKFSRERFGGEKQARVWWEENRSRIQKQCI